MPWDRKSLFGYVETIQLILGVTDKRYYISACVLLNLLNELRKSDKMRG